MSYVAAGATAASAIPGIFKLFSGNKQAKEAKALAASNTLSPYQTPSQIKEATDLAQREYTNGMPGMAAAKDNLLANSAASLSAGIQGATSSGDILDLASKNDYNQGQALNGLNNQYLQYHSNALGNYSNALKTEAGYADKEYQNNILEPYIRKANLASAMYGAGKTNEFGGLDSLSTSALAGLTAYSNYKKSGA